MKKKIRLKQRHQNLRNERKIFLIICEGEKTERVYFKAFRKRDNGIRIEVPHSSYTDPVNLVKFAIKITSDYGIDVDRGDRVWCVFDVDLNTDALLTRARKEADGHGINIVLSNPSFELWYLLHFEYSTAHIRAEKVIRKLSEKHIKNYQKNISCFNQVQPLLGQAVRHAGKLNHFHEQNGTNLFSSGSNPSTQAFELVKEIIGIDVGF